MFLDKQSLDPHDRLRHETKDDGNVLFLDKRPLYPSNRLRHRTKDDDDVLFLNKQPLHPDHRLKQKAKRLQLDVETLIEVPFVNIDVPLDTKESSVRIIKKLPADNNKYYIEHEEGWNTFKILEDPQQKSKRYAF